jgi:tetratricopeptide (TPR) repeat protein
MNRAALVKALSRLTPTDFAMLVASMEGANNQVSGQGTTPQQVAQLIAWAESTRGPGLKSLERTFHELVGGGAASNARPRNLQFTTIGTLFKGRDDFLSEIRAILTRCDRRAVVVYGLGGVGKTRAALEYAWKHEASYTALLLVSVPSAEKLRADLANLVDVLGIVAAPTGVDQQAAEVLKWLEAHPGWLLIIDNVDSVDLAREVEELLINLRAGHVLITARVSDWNASVALRELRVLAQGDAVSFLLERTGQAAASGDSAAKCAEIVDELGCLALALEQAGAYIAHHRLSFTEYLDQWRRQRSRVLTWHDKRLMQYPESVAITWETSFVQLAEAEQRLLQVLAWLAPDPIPLFFFESPPLRPAIPEPREALAGLAKLSLARVEAESGVVVIHRLVQEVARSRGDVAERQQALRTALDAINSVGSGAATDVREWSVWTPIAAHVAAVAAHADEANLADPTVRLMNSLALYYGARGRYREAEPLLRRALAIDEQIFGKEHPNVAVRLDNLAQVLLDTDRHDEAEQMMRRALAIAERSLGAGHPTVATILNNLGQLLLATDRLDEAQQVLRRALAIDERFYGSDDPAVSTILNNLAQALRGTGRDDETEQMMRRALEIDERVYGEDHPQVALHLSNLAQLLRDTNRIEAAKQLMCRALGIAEKAYGKEHSTVAIRLNNLAKLLQATNRLAEAEPLSRRHLEIFLQFTRSNSHEHRHLRAASENYASLLRAMGNGHEQIADRLKALFSSYGVSPPAGYLAPVARSPRWNLSPGVFISHLGKLLRYSTRWTRFSR